MQPLLHDGTLLSLLERIPARTEGRSPAWRILVVDTDDTIYRETRSALARVSILGRPLTLLHAHDAGQALKLLDAHRDIAVVLVDATEPHSDYGLRLARQIRNELKLQEVRIILHTDQDGPIPELAALARYDIDDYCSKSELAATRLVTSLTSAIRSREQVYALNAARHGLSTIVDATSNLLEIKTQQDFATTILDQVQALLGARSDGLIVLAEGPEPQRQKIIGATGRFQFATIPGDHNLATEISRSFAERLPVVRRGRHLTLYVPARNRSLVVLLEFATDAPRCEEKLLRLFVAHIRLCADNLAYVEQLRDSAYRDSLTGLPNRTHLIDELASTFNSGHDRMSLALVDMDNFNTIAEAMGQEKANTLLRDIAHRLTERFRDQNIFIARTSGDEFALLGPEDALSPQRLQTLFSVPFLIDATAVPLTATIGLAPVGGPCASPGAVLSSAYSALKRGKGREQNSVNVYTTALSRELSDRVSLAQDMRTALLRNEFHVVLQPQVRLSDHKVTGVEALLRWRRQDGTMVPPADFIPVAERAGLIGAIGEWVFRTACKHLASLRHQGATSLLLAVNVSVAQLRDPAFSRTVEGILREFAIPPQLVEIEITESIAIEGLDSFMATIDQLKDIGLRVALDDFGTGFSSLTLLHQLRIDRLKLDSSFVRELGRGRRSERVARTIVELGLGLGMEVIAEGVETTTQAEHLQAIGCHGAQGYLFGRPMELRALAVWLGASAVSAA